MLFWQSVPSAQIARVLGACGFPQVPASNRQMYVYEQINLATAGIDRTVLQAIGWAEVKAMRPRSRTRIREAIGYIGASRNERRLCRNPINDVGSAGEQRSFHVVCA